MGNNQRFYCPWLNQTAVVLVVPSCLRRGRIPYAKEDTFDALRINRADWCFLILTSPNGARSVRFLEGVVYRQPAKAF